MKTAMKKALRILPVCMALILCLSVPSFALGEDLVPATDTPAGAYTYFPNGIPQNLVFYFPKALTEGFWQNLPESIYYDYPDHNLPADALEYYRLNLEPLLSSPGGHIPGLPKQAYSFYPNGLPDDFLAYFPSAMKEEFWTYFPNSIAMDYGDELPPNAWNYFLSVSPGSLNLGIMPLTDPTERPEVTAEVHHYLREGQSMLLPGTAKYEEDENNILTVTDASFVKNDDLARTGVNDEYDGDLIGLNKCVYTFTQDAATGNWIMKAKEKVNGQDVYFTPASYSVNVYHDTAPHQVKIGWFWMGQTEGDSDPRGYRYYFVENSRSIFFEKVISSGRPLRLDHWGIPKSNQDVSLLFDIYKHTEEHNGDIVTHTYSRITNPNSLVSGGEYLICFNVCNSKEDLQKEFGDYRYVIHPSLDFKSAYTQTVKWTDGVQSNTVTGYRVSANALGGASSMEGTVIVDSVAHVFHVLKAPTSADMTGNVASDCGAGRNGEIDKLSISNGSVYNLKAMAGHSAGYWVSSDDAVASVDQVGKVTATGITDTQKRYGKCWVGYDCDTCKKLHAVEVVVIDQVRSADTKLMDIYLTRDDEHSDLRVASVSNGWYDGSYPLKKTYAKEVYYYEFDVNEEAGLVFFDKPFFGDLNSDKNSPDPPQWAAGGEEKAGWFTVAQEDIRINGQAAAEINRNNEASLEPFRPAADSSDRNNAVNDHIYALLNTAKEQGFGDYVTFVFPSALDSAERYKISARLQMGSSPIIRLASVDGTAFDWAGRDKEKVYRLVVTETAPGGDFPNAQTFGVTDGDYAKSAKLNIYVTEDNVPLANTVLADDYEVRYTFATNPFTTTGMDGRYLSYAVRSIHSGEVRNWENAVVTEESGAVTVKLKANQFSPFLITPTDEYYKVTIDWKTTDAQVEYRNNYRWNPKELRYERISTQLFTTAPGKAEIKVTNESTRDVAYAISHADKAVSEGKYTMEVEEIKEAEADSNASAALTPGNGTAQSKTYEASFYVKDGSGMPEADYGKSEVAIGTFTVTVGKPSGE